MVLDKKASRIVSSLICLSRSVSSANDAFALTSIKNAFFCVHITSNPNTWKQCEFVLSFLIWSKEVGNDLITPHPEFGFPGLKEGDSWCVCATWYARAIEEGKACSIFLKKTNARTLDLIPLEKLKKFAVDLS